MDSEQREGYQDENCMKSNEEFYKTQLCFKFMRGNCRFRSCRFAHGMEELRHAHAIPMPAGSARESSTLDKYKEKDPANVTEGVLQRSGGFNTKRGRVCYQWEATGTCNFGDRCRYPHESQKHAKEPKGFKTGDLYDSKNYPRPQPGWIRQTLNEGAVSHLVHTENMVRPTHIAVKTTNPIKNAIVTSIDKSPENINKEKSNAVHGSGFQTSLSRWKGPQKITRIYGDWIDE